MDKGFIDIGSGKGKVVITASLWGFKKVLGIEFAPGLVKTAQTNLARVAEKLPKNTTASVVCADATSYNVDANACVFFLFNPFGADVMKGFCRQVAKSLREHPWRIWIIYADPEYIAIMINELPVHELPRMIYGGFEFAF